MNFLKPWDFFSFLSAFAEATTRLPIKAFASSDEVNVCRFKTKELKNYVPGIHT